MTYLYGDSSPSGIAIDYIDFLGRILDLSVAILQAEERVLAARERRRELERAVAREVDRLEELGVDIHGLLEPLSPRDSDRPAGRCARVIERAVFEAISGEITNVRADLAADLERIDGEVACERRAYVGTLQGLLLRYDLPGAENHIHLALDFGEQYTAQLRSHTGYGAATSIDLEVPAESIFARQVRLGRFGDGLEVHCPERVGWIRKQVKMIRHGLGKHYLTELVCAPDRISFKARTTPEFSSPGYNVVIDRVAGEVDIACRKSTDGELTAFEVGFEDVAPLIELGQALADEAQKLARCRRALLEVALDGEPLIEHDEPAALVARMVEAMAATVRDIAAHSQSPGELVLRSVLGDNRREEIFAGKSELARKLAPLDERLRALFEPLELGPVPEPDSGPESDSPGEPDREPEAALDSEPDGERDDQARADGFSCGEGRTTEILTGELVVFEEGAEGPYPGGELEPDPGEVDAGGRRRAESAGLA